MNDFRHIAELKTDRDEQASYITKHGNRIVSRVLLMVGEFLSIACFMYVFVSHLSTRKKRFAIANP